MYRPLDIQSLIPIGAPFLKSEGTVGRSDLETRYCRLMLEFKQRVLTTCTGTYRFSSVIFTI